MRINTSTLSAYVALADSVSDVKIGDNGLLYALDSSGNIIARGALGEMEQWFIKQGQIPHPSLWLRASDLTLDDDDPVASWTSAEGNAYEFTQTEADAKPLYTVDGMGGYPGVVFDGTDDYLYLASAPLNDQSGTLFVVSDIVDQNVAAGTYLATCRESDAYYYAAFIAEASTEKFAFYRRTGSALAMRAVKGTEAKPYDPSILSIDTDGSSYNIALDGVAATVDGTDNGEWIADITNRVNTTIGAKAIDTVKWFLKGTLSELRYYSTQLNAAQKALVVAELKSTYGIT